MPGFISSIKAKLPNMPSMTTKSPVATPAATETEVEPTAAAIPEETATPAEPITKDATLHVPGELPLASASDLALPQTPEPAATATPAVEETVPATEAPAPVEVAEATPAPTVETTPAPIVETTPAPIVEATPPIVEATPTPPVEATPAPIAEAPAPVQAPAPVEVAPVVAEEKPIEVKPEEPAVETVVVGPITGGEPGLSEPVPGLPEASSSTAEEPSATTAEATPAVLEPATAPIEPSTTPTGEAPSTLSFPTTQSQTNVADGKENQPGAGHGEGMGRKIRLSIRRFGRSSEKVPGRKSLDAGARKSMDAPRKSMDVSETPIVEEDDENEKKKVPLGDKLKGVFEEVKGRVKKDPEAVAYGKALRSGDLNV